MLYKRKELDFKSVSSSRDEFIQSAGKRTLPHSFICAQPPHINSIRNDETRDLFRFPGSVVPGDLVRRIVQPRADDRYGFRTVSLPY
jgi:hypothetical protein